jgi:hypothetical protein
VKITKRQLRRIIKEALSSEVVVTDWDPHEGEGMDMADREVYADKFWKDNYKYWSEGENLGELEYAADKLRVELRYQEDHNGDLWTRETIQFAVDEIQDELDAGSYYRKG